MLQQVNDGYEVAGGDSGHLLLTNGYGISIPGQRISFLQDPNETTEWIHNSVASTTPPTKALTGIFYGKSPSYSYYEGCSTGGAQGFTLAQYHPELFHGIVAGSPGNWYSHLLFGFLWNYIHTQKTFLDQDTLNFITNATLEKCDRPDGLMDGVIGDLLHCHFDISEIECAGEQTRNNSEGIQCVTSAEVATYQTIRAGPSEASTGRKVYPGFDFGSESSWLLQETELALNFTVPVLQNLVFKNLSYDYTAFDFGSANLNAVDSKASPLIDSISADLRAFKNRGNLIVTQGWSDPYNAATRLIQQFELISRFLTSNGVAAGNTSDFYRLFMIPGYGHCGPAAAYPQVPGTVDDLGALVSWVEKGIAPLEIKSTGPADGTNRTRKLCTWPRTAKYVGNNPDDWESLRCAERGKSGFPDVEGSRRRYPKKFQKPCPFCLRHSAAA